MSDGETQYSQTEKEELGNSVGLWMIQRVFIHSDHPRLTPKSISNAEICQSFSKDYMFLNAVSFIHNVSYR